MEGTLAPAAYRRFIAWQYLAHARSEPGLAEFPWRDHAADYAYAARLPQLNQEVAAADRPVAEPLPPPATLAVATGRAYVLEGSSLGGNVIFGHLERNPRLAAFAPFAHYAFQRAHGVGQWRRFAAFAKTHVWSAAEAEEAVVAAREVFDVFLATAP